MDLDYNIIGCHKNALLPNEGINKISKPDIYTVSKLNIDITQCAKYIFNDPLNLNTNTPSYNFTCKDYGTHTTPPKNRKGSQPGGISRKEGKRP